MPCQLEADSADTFPGRTFYSADRPKCLKPTAVYVPTRHAAGDRDLTVVLWLHGYYVKTLKFLFQGDRSKLREQVRDSGADVVLIAPFLGKMVLNANDEFEGDYSVRDLDDKLWGERYLDEVMPALGAALGGEGGPVLNVKNLVIACHSGGGSGMRKLIDTLGKYRPGLRACWGFDCLYGAKASPDDATFWHDRMLGSGALPLHVIYGGSTLKQSVKLDLMGQGLATKEGNRALPNTHPPMGKLHVDIGQTLAVRTDRLMFPEKGKDAAQQRAIKSKRGVFVQQAIDNLARSVKFDKDIHYMIARDGFKARLSAASF